MRALVWLRRDLRTIDNTALIRAMDNVEQANSDDKGLIALFTVTQKQWQEHGVSAMQQQLIFRRLQALSIELAELKVQLHIEVVDHYQDCGSLISQLCERMSIKHVFANADYEVNEVQRDQQVKSKLESQNIPFTLCSDKCVFAPGSILNKQSSYFKVFTPFKKSWLQRFNPAQLAVRKPIALTVNKLFDGEQGFELCSKMGDAQQALSATTVAWHADTQSIINQLRLFSFQKANNYHDNRDVPSVNGTSQLSPYLALGMLSVRQCIARLLNGRHPEHLSEGEQTWLSELIWREFYQHLIYFQPKLCKGANFVAWCNNIRWQGDIEHLKSWQQGATGYPIVDAAMKQLNQTGWMHNRLRMIVASFLSKDLLLDWRFGERYFMSQLVDGDFAANNGGWQWSASTGCDAQPYFRIFNPISQGKKFDPQGEFVKQWLPELQSVPDKYIHSPWLWEEFASLDYPDPIVDHKKQRQLALQMYKEAKNSEC
ncbi:deoxyribodipyrimidine photo-lyase [Vibrio halioticoli NBRC 102217]|uniref:Deoxyribodipyrimidine photo-lyase n=1 Tax=Vibrio halioticoli NBRC 102217 TaxID=1219072 RepID=V5HIH6_9VIBR|nr:deoxyribodipyrimidine photo-lyase [Vibrio halioticoli]GAD89140.1 deoxyribodipyrimidine photo-lyase [Vibrio halioticoli NBRC 102217]